MKPTKISHSVSNAVEDPTGKRNDLPAQLFAGVNDKPRWEELNELREANAKAIVTMAVNIDSLVKTTQDELPQEKRVELAALISTFNDDSNQIITELNAIQKAHKDKKGEISKEKDVIKVFDLGLEYQAVADLIRNSLNPLAIQITSICASVASMEDNLKEAEKMMDSVRQKTVEQTKEKIEQNKEELSKGIEEIHTQLVENKDDSNTFDVVNPPELKD